jgi:hypothetical protein
MIMGRIQLFEFEDQKWFPQFLRNYGTDFLRFLSNKTHLFGPALPVIKEGLENSPAHKIVDLGSGGGGPLLDLTPELFKAYPDLQITLTDQFPNLPAFKLHKRLEINITYREEPVDARNIPEELNGLRTLFLLLHHLPPQDAKTVLENAVETGNPIAIFEAQERSAASIIAMLLSPLTVLFTTPFIKPFSWGRLFFTYLVPVVPLFVLWDGVVSSLRTYSDKEMHHLVDSLPQKDKFIWKTGRERSGPGVIIYLLGIPK